jgi:hypothetical protein
MKHQLVGGKFLAPPTELARKEEKGKIDLPFRVSSEALHATAAITFGAAYSSPPGRITSSGAFLLIKRSSRFPGNITVPSNA